MSQHTQRIRVVIIDSSAQRREALKALLAAEDVEVVAAAHNAHEAIRATQWAAPEVVVMDSEFSDMDSLELVQALAAQPLRPRIVIVTAVSDAVRLRGLLLAGARQFMAFPPKPADLLQAVRGDGR